MANPRDPVIARYRLISDAVRVTIRIIENGAAKSIIDHNKVVAGNPQPTDFVPLVNWAILSKRASIHGVPTADVVNQLKDAVESLERLAVVELAAVFEFTLRKHLTQAATTWIPTGSKDQAAFQEIVTKEIEWWNYKEVLIDLFPTVDAVDPNLRMRAKQIVERRNWVAHGKHTDPTVKEPSNTTAEDAYSWLTAFLKAAAIVT
jgi:hypothetical protein